MVFLHERIPSPMRGIGVVVDHRSEGGRCLQYGKERGIVPVSPVHMGADHNTGKAEVSHAAFELFHRRADVLKWQEAETRKPVRVLSGDLGEIVIDQASDRTAIFAIKRMPVQGWRHREDV